MATTIVPADAVATTGVTLTLGGKTFDIEFSRTISSVTVADRRVVEVPFASEVELISLTAVAGAVGRGMFTKFDGFFIMNRDDTNFCRIRLAKAGAETVDIKLVAGEYMIFWNSKFDVDAGEGAFAAYVDWDVVSVQADTADLDIEYLAIAI